MMNDLDNQLPYLRLKSISAQNTGIDETVNYLVQKFKSLGADEIKLFSEYQNPVVFASFQGKSDKTVLFYNHYDVQPPEPLNEWHTDPFEPTIVDGQLVARGASDDKGELMSRLSVLSYFKQNGGFPCNLKFFVEGEEEIGSPDITPYIKNHAADLACDAMIWEGGGKNAAEKFQVIAGTKGIASFDVSVESASTDIHSSLAGYVDNAAWRLVKGLSSLTDSEHHVLVDHFYDDVKPLDDYESQVVDGLETGFNKTATVKNLGLVNGLTTDRPVHEVMTQPTLTINGLTSGYEGQGIKTIIPRTAHAKLDCRLVPGQDPAKSAELIQKQLVKNGFPDLKLHFNLGEPGFKTPLQDTFVQQNLSTAKQVYGADNVVLVPNQPGGGPMLAFYNEVKAPIVAVGIRNANGNPHAPNENFRLQDYQQASVFLATLLRQYAKD
ncbi:M20/M25/M40 family metallo-hydrolase [Secundilactobacillus yichangensis]|uniref:M20/M25/M40 family metallo-hydrolase n=1 Tax=Secundilactobacillus yichangensis TaxID=2799580 RepID=UPI0019453C5D